MPSFEKGDRGARILRVQAMLQRNPHGLSVPEIATRCQVTVRTSYRDLGALEAMGVPLAEEGGRWSIEKDYFLAPVHFGLDEAVALLLSARLMHRYADENDPQVAAAFVKLAAVLPPSIAAYVHETVRQMEERAPDPVYGRVFSALVLAWAHRRVARITYLAPRQSQPVVRTIHPYFLEPSSFGHACYVIARDVERQGLRTFKIERIRACELLEARYEIPSDFDLRAYFAGSWGIFQTREADMAEVRLRFTPGVAERVRESRWHPSQVLQTESDGGVVLSVRVTGILEITPWILTWGDSVEVLAPAALRESVAAIAGRMARRYKKTW
jgi:predicted DNA-binding transcriptional regulator YafY